MKRQLLFVLMAVLCLGTFAQFEHQRVYSTFDNLPLAKADTFNNGADRAGGFSHYGRYWNNNYDTMWNTWSGWAISNMTDTVTSGFGNQFSAITGSGVSHTTNYMVSSGDGAYIKLDSVINISGAYFTNATYTARDMEQGSGFSKKFGGDDGNDEDFLRVIISSYLADVFVDSTILYLADYRFADNSKDYILKDWTFVDFNNDEWNDIYTDSISIRYEGSDTGMFGLNTPKYICMDDFNPKLIDRVSLDIQPPVYLDNDTFYNGSDNAGGFVSQFLFFPNSFNTKWGSWSGWSVSSMNDILTPGFENQYSAIKLNPNGGTHFVSGGQENEVRGLVSSEMSNELYKTGGYLTTNLAFSITNSTYAALDMELGSGFSKKFGGDNGNDPDYFRLLVSFLDIEENVLSLDTVYLADYRFDDNSKDYILKDWREVKSFSNGGSKFHKIKFKLESSDVGMFGMNTPAYFCMAYDFQYVGIDDITKKASIDVYPNPSHGSLNIVADDMISSFSVHTIGGQIISDLDFTLDQNKMQLDVSSLNSGIYFVRVQTEKGIATQKFVKQ